MEAEEKVMGTGPQAEEPKSAESLNVVKLRGLSRRIGRPGLSCGPLVARGKSDKEGGILVSGGARSLVTGHPPSFAYVGWAELGKYEIITKTTAADFGSWP